MVPPLQDRALHKATSNRRPNSNSIPPKAMGNPPRITAMVGMTMATRMITTGMRDTI